MHSIKTRMIILYVMLVLVVMTTTGTVVMLGLSNNEKNKAYSLLNNYSKKVSVEIVDFFEEEDFKTGLERLFMVESNNVSRGVQIIIFDATGLKPIAYTDYVENYTSPVIISAINGEKKFNAWRKADDTTGTVKRWFEVAVPTESKITGKEYIIYVREDATLSMALLVNMSNSLIMALGVSMTVGVILGNIFSMTLTGPIIGLTKKAKEFSEGQFDENLKIYSNDEIGQLTKTFNNMSKNLNRLIDNLNLEKNKIEIILNNMTEGILAYDMNGKLIHANKASSELLGYKDLEKISMRKMFEILKVDVSELPMQDKDISIEREEEINKTYVNIKINSYENRYRENEGTIIVLQDITRHMKLEKMRKEFVANVSHELRTPLTTIKLYSETLQDMVSGNEMATSFLNIMSDETNRMTLLVKDLLDLSSFDNDKTVLKISKVNLVNIIKTVMRQNEVVSSSKNQKISFNYGDEVYVECDESRINQVITNIVVNSIKYSDEGKNIEIEVNEGVDEVSIKIKDEGIGIDKDSLERVFERFYRVDKARSRSRGGTGLGLAISRQIIKAHKGTIKMESKINEGTTTTITLPKKTNES